MDDVSRVSRVEFIPGRGQTATLPKRRREGKAAKLPKAEISDDEFHLHAEPAEESLESLDKDHVDLEI